MHMMCASNDGTLSHVHQKCICPGAAPTGAVTASDGRCNIFKAVEAHCAPSWCTRTGDAVETHHCRTMCCVLQGIKEAGRFHTEQGRVPA